MNELRFPAGEWWFDLDTETESNEELVIDQVGPVLQAADPRFVVITGWQRKREWAGPRWARVRVRRDAEAMDSGPGWTKPGEGSQLG